MVADHPASARLVLATVAALAWFTWQWKIAQRLGSLGKSGHTVDKAQLGSV